jgi:DNA primase
LRKSGRGLVGLCPFHSEKTPSFNVSVENQMFYCFGCETGGDVITFIEKIEKLDYIESLSFLAKQAGLEMPAEDGDESAAFLKRRILEINRMTAHYFHHCLLSPDGGNGLEYFKKRMLTHETIKSFGLGYALKNNNNLIDNLTEKGFTFDEIVAAGIIGKNSSNGNYYDMFRNRVMFPIIDLRGNVIAFGGRVLDDSSPKYLNSRDTPVFNKSRCLFALNFAKNGNNNSMILCEGYMDAIALHQAGFKNAVATLGTALTQEQSRLMARYAKEVIISYDSDKAGQNATQRAIGFLNSAGLSVRVLHINGGKDPDEYIKTFGADKFRLMIEKSSNHIEYRLNEALSKYDTEITEQLAGYLKDAAAILATVESSIERDVYAGKLSEKLGVSKESILSDVLDIAHKKNRSEYRSKLKAELNASLGYKDKLNPEKSKYLLASIAEENLIILLLKNPDYYGEIKKLLEPENFVTAFNKKVFEALCNEITNVGESDISQLSKYLSADEIGKISFLFLTRQVSNTIEEVRDCCDVILQEKININANTDNTLDVFAALQRKKLDEKKKAGGSNR